MLKPDDPFDIKLSAGRESKPYGLVLDGGSGALTIGIVAQDDTVYVRNVAKRPGDFDEQRSWKGGRGIEKFNDNEEGFWDSRDGWSLTKGHFHNGILWRFAKGLRTAQDNFSNSKSWRALKGDALGISVSFTVATAANYDKAQLWVRWNGSPSATNTLTLKLCSDSSGSPGTVLKTATKTIADVESDVLSMLLDFDWTTTEALSTTIYHIFLYGDSTSTDAGHWEVAVDETGSSSKIASDPAGAPSWVAPLDTFSMLYRITDADTSRMFKPFFLDNHLYFVTLFDDGATASQIYVTGDRGQATGGSTTTLIDTAFGCRSAAWADNVLAGAKIRFKKNNKWYYATILSHSGSTYTFESATTVAPASGNPYYIYGTEYLTEITGHGLGVVTGEPATLNGIVFFPQGDAVAIRQMTTDFTAANCHKFTPDAGADPYATLLLAHYDPGSNSGILWRANNDTVTVSYAVAIAYDANFSWNPDIVCGDTTYPITNLDKQPGVLHVLKENGNGQVVNGRFTWIDSGSDDTPDQANGMASLVVDKYLYYSWLHTVIRVFSSSHDDVGQDYRSFGLPDDREGNIAYMDAYLILPLMAVDAGGGYSSVLAFDGLGWHELLRGYGAGKRIRMVKAQPNPGARNRIWTEIGGELVFQDMPFKKSSPKLDSGMLYMHETVLESSILDMGAASDLPKRIKQLTLTVRNLDGQGRKIYLDYQTDNNCHTTTWTAAETLLSSPESIANLSLENIRRFDYRLRMFTDDASIPIDIEGVVPNGYARTPMKQLFTMRIKEGGLYQIGGQNSQGFSKLWTWLMEHARHPYGVTMQSKYEELDNITVIIHPPRAYPYIPPRPGQPAQGILTLTLEEA